jgi:hypothetical protein
MPSLDAIGTKKASNTFVPKYESSEQSIDLIASTAGIQRPLRVLAIDNIDKIDFVPTSETPTKHNPRHNILITAFGQEESEETMKLARDMAHVITGRG